MAHPVLILLYIIPTILATPLGRTPSQTLSQPLLESAPVLPVPLRSANNRTLSATEIGCFKPDKPWPRTNKADCEEVLDYWVRGQDLSEPRIFSQNPAPRSPLKLVHLPTIVYSGTCRMWINVLDEGDEEELTMADVYAHVMGPDGLAKNCLGQHDAPAIGGRMMLGRRGLLSVSISGLKESPS